MSDQGRQGKSRFEPPPWEKEAFDELARKRAAEEGRRRAEQADEAVLAAAPAGEPPVTAVPQAAQAATRETTPRAATVAAKGTAEGGARPVLDERQVSAMLLQLRGEEPAVAETVEPFSKVVAAVVGIIGGVMFVVSLVTLSRTTGQPLGMIGSIVVGGFGMFLVGTAVWLWVRPTRAKGSR